MYFPACWYPNTLTITCGNPTVFITNRTNHNTYRVQFSCTFDSTGCKQSTRVCSWYKVSDDKPTAHICYYICVRHGPGSTLPAKWIPSWGRTWPWQVPFPPWASGVTRFPLLHQELFLCVSLSAGSWRASSISWFTWRTPGLKLLRDSRHFILFMPKSSKHNIVWRWTVFNQQHQYLNSLKVFLYKLNQKEPKPNSKMSLGWEANRRKLLSWKQCSWSWTQTEVVTAPWIQCH